MVILCGDTHVRLQEPYVHAITDFFSWCETQDWNTPENTFIHLGDFFDSSALNGELVSLAHTLWGKIKCKKILLEGNHDTSRRLGSALTFMSEMDVEVISVKQERVIEGKSYLFLPHPKRKDIEEEYRNLSGDYDVVLGHFAVLPLFGHEIPLPPELKFRDWLFGHVHIPDATKSIYLGVPVAQAWGEDKWEHKLGVIDGALTYRPVPSFLEYAVIDYNIGLPPASRNKPAYKTYHVYDIVNAPSVKAAYEKFGGLPIRKITTLLTQDAPEFADKGLLEQGRETLVDEFLSQYEKPAVTNKIRALLSVERRCECS